MFIYYISYSYTLYTLFKASAYLVVIVFDTATRCCCLCTYFYQVCPHLVCLHVLINCTYPILINFWGSGMRAHWNMVSPKWEMALCGFSLWVSPSIYVTDSKFRLWKTWQGSCIAEENGWWGHQWMHSQIMAIPLCMHSTFPTEIGEQTILTSFSHVIIAQLMHLEYQSRHRS